MIIRGVGGCINVLDKHFSDVMEHVAPQKKNKFTKKIHLGLQLDMASQCCLVAVCGFCVATSALALKRREEEKIGRVNVALILFG